MTDNLTLRLLAGGNVSVTKYTGKGSATPAFSQADLGKGTFLDITTDSLTIKAASVNINSGGTAITSASLFYRVYLTGTTTANKPFYSQLNLALASPDNTNSAPVVYNAAGQSIDLMSVVRSSGGGSYTVDIYYQMHYDDGNGDTGDPTDPGNGATNPYSATFNVKAPAVTPNGSTTIWQGVIDSDWLKPGNWTNGVPTSTSNAIVQEKQTGSTNAYPILTDNTKTYEVYDLTLNGNLNSNKALLTVQVATLTVYGNIRQDAGGLVGISAQNRGVRDPSQNSTLVLAGTGEHLPRITNNSADRAPGTVNQIITGPLQMPDIVVAGSGIKALTGNITVLNTLSFIPSSAADGAVLQTSVESPTNVISFSTTGSQNIDLRTDGLISVVANNSETTSSYVRGITISNRQLVINKNETFGNIGIELKPNHTPSSNVNIAIKRTVGDPLLGPTPNAVNPAVPIKRQYQITNDDNSNNSNYSSSNVDVIFRYLPSVYELNGISENNLTMFRTINNGVPYEPTGGTEDVINHIFTRLALPSLADYVLTLGDKTNPLPVSLVAFGAIRSGANTLLSWTTASEERNTGFNVQVSTDGTNFRTLSFVASQSPNSSTTLNYKYTDTEAGKTGIRYYRLEQVDEGGAKNYSPVRLVNFSGTATGTGVLVAYPNPFNEGVSLSLDGSTVADGTALVKLVDMTGRTVRESKLPLVGASLTLSDMGTLRSGLYLAKVTLPDGSTQTVRISKQ